MKKNTSPHFRLVKQALGSLVFMVLAVSVANKVSQLSAGATDLGQRDIQIAYNVTSTATPVAATDSPTAAPTATPTPAPTAAPTSTPTATATPASPTPVQNSATATPVPTNGSSTSATATPKPAITATPRPSGATATPKPASGTASPAPTATAAPGSAATPIPTSTPATGTPIPTTAASPTVTATPYASTLRTSLRIIQTSALANQSGQTGTAQPGYIFSGTAAPDSDVVITIHSDTIVLTVHTDQNGHWQYVLHYPLEQGGHTITVEGTDPSTGKPVTVSQNFIIPKAEAASVLNGNPSITTDPLTFFPPSYIIPLIVIILVAMTLAIILYKRELKNHTR
ncbi:hypothetical protein KGQ71_01420 [Patescibacteria group bacterium]|nr:hypothetical protein [Patescibacteria group bacterium]